MLWICWGLWWVITKCLDYLTHVNESIIKGNDYYNDVWMLVKILICKLNKLISHIFRSVFSSAKANSHVHKGIINIFKPWSLIKEWALAKTKFGKHLPLALHSLFYFSVYFTNSYSLATSLLKSLPRTSRIWTPVFLFFPTYAKMLITSGSTVFPIYSPCFHNSSPSSFL